MRVIIAFLPALLAVATGCAEDRCDPSLWREVTPTVQAHESFGVAVLESGHVLVVGGHALGDGGRSDSRYIDDVEIYDPMNDRWRATTSLPEVLEGISQLVVLPDRRVMLVGETTRNATRARVDLYDPVSESWSQTGSLVVARDGSWPTRLGDDRVLAAGGIDYYAPGRPVHASAEVYDPATETWSLVGAMSVPRVGHRTARLADGSVLVVGGTDIEDSDHHLALLERFDPTTLAFHASGELHVARSQHAVATLTGGRVLVAGGAVGAYGHHTSLRKAELYDPGTETTVEVGDMLEARASFTLLPLADGRALAVGGVVRQDGNRALASAEVFDPETGVWSSAGCMHVARWQHSTVALADDSILAIGGFNNGTGQLRSVERLDHVP
ncbi:MAG: hypothetical protein H0T46_08470 [Deltaproteobacteria bacterium]|nr:hypothetical protein [Deltaproteobacteria bacterium]